MVKFFNISWKVFVLSALLIILMTVFRNIIPHDILIYLVPISSAIFFISAFSTLIYLVMIIDWV